MLARRLVERGVRFVQVYSGDTNGWDAHSDVADNHGKLCMATDLPVAGLLQDLKQALAQGVDAVYLDLHGAAVAEHADDAEGELLSRVRALIGENIVHGSDSPESAVRELGIFFSA
jgi:hypothetical protein